MARYSDSGSRSDDDDDDDDRSEWSSNGLEDGDSSLASEASSQVVKDEGLPMSPGQAAAVIQGMYRRKKAREFFVERVRQAYEKVFDEENDVYFYYNKLTGTSEWTVPRVLLGRPLDPKEEWAARKVQALYRQRHAWKQLMFMLNSVYEKEYDPDTDSWFYVNKVTKQTTWDKPIIFGLKEPPTNASDAALLNKEREIGELRKELERQREEAAKVKKALEDKIAEELVLKGELDADEAKGRSRHMDEWNVDDVVEWFQTIGHMQYEKQIREHKVDGLLLLHLMNEDWGHLGITSPLTVRRIDVAMQEYRLRFERKQAGDVEEEEGSDVSGSDTPSELLDDDDMYDDDDSGQEDNEDDVAVDDQDYLNEDELAELQRDEENIKKEEDGGSGSRRRRGGPGNGEEQGGTVIESSRRNRRRPLEFVVGAEQVVKGIDRSIRQMLFGERARVFVTSLYAYGDKGHPPMIPPNAALVFDVNLLDFWPRPRWQKPLVQVLSDPYRETPYAPRAGGGSGGGGGGGGAENSSGDGSSNGASAGADGKTKKPRDYPYGKVGRN
eukprot:g6417.t1